MKKTAIFLGAVCAAFTSVPASAALLVNWKTGQYREVSWEFCHVVGQNFADFQCFGGLSFTDEALSDEQTKEAVKKFDSKTLPAEPTPAETQTKLFSNHNTTRSNRATIAAPPEDGMDDAGPVGGKRKCVKSGGTWATNSNGSFCLRTLPLEK